MITVDSTQFFKCFGTFTSGKYALWLDNIGLVHNEEMQNATEPLSGLLEVWIMEAILKQYSFKGFKSRSKRKLLIVTALKNIDTILNHVV